MPVEAIPIRPAVIERLRPFILLGRISNLPTVWSNCLAAWMLGGAGSWTRFVQLAAGATLLYTGGMFLNDAVDEDFDREHRPERPIPSGQVNSRSVWMCAATCLGLGWLVLLPLGATTALLASVLLGAIVLYDVIHKRTPLAPLLMALCRFLLYYLAASAAQFDPHYSVFWPALALAAYITGLSFLARCEPTRLFGPGGLGSLGLLFAPVLLAVTNGVLIKSMSGIILAATGGWILWCLRLGYARMNYGHCVPGLLAGIVLVDWLAVPGVDWVLASLFLGWFLLALTLQRVIPAS